MDQGLVTNPKDLEQMQQELVSLARRISELEDTELEVMEQLEAAQAERSGSPTGSPTIDARAAELVASRDSQAGEIDRARPSRDRRAQGHRRPACPPTCSRSTRGCAPRRAASGPRSCAQRRCSGCSLELTPPTSA